MNDERILIIGGGPIGALTGYCLAHAGIPVTVFDKEPKPPEDHRAATLQPSTLDLFEPLGFTPEILKIGLQSRFFQWRDRETHEVVAEFDYDVLKDESRHPYVIQLEQHKTVNVVLAAAAKLDTFTLHRPVEVLAVRQFEDHVEADVLHEDGTTETHRGRYMVGCDGGRSVVRKTIDVTFDGFTYPERFNIISTTHDFGESHKFRLRNYCAHPNRWVSLMKVPGEDGQALWRCVFPAKTEESDEEVMSDEWIQARFAECLPGAHPYPVVHRNMYNVHQRVAGNFAVGRIALAGDSAHINNPIGGMGMNSGFQDGMTLAAKLIEIWHGADPKPLLERYDRQRRLTAIEYVQAQSMANKRMLEENDPETRRKTLDELRRRAADPAAHLDYVRRSALVSMWEKSESIQ